MRLSSVALSLVLLASATAAAAGPRADVALAKRLAEGREWEELYLAFSATPPASFSAPDRAALSLLLTRGGEALEKGDKVMAYSLADRAVAFEPSAPALLLLARTARATDQGADAERALSRGLEAFPADGRFAVQLATLYLEEQAPGKALAVLEKVPKKGKAELSVVARARRALAEESAARATALRVEQRMNGGAAAAGVASAKGSGPGETVVSGLSWESAEQGGMRTRSNARFRLRYFNNDRDFGQRAEYEGKVVEALDAAWAFSQSVLGRTRVHPLEVVLYTREEFAIHQGAEMARVAAGLYSQGAIRMNDSAELTAQAKATLVHEYIHAVVDDLSGGRAGSLPTWLNEGLAEYVEQRFQGRDGPPHWMVKRLAAGATTGAVPPLSALSRGPLIAGADPALLYSFSAAVVRQMWKTGGAENVMALLSDVAGGKPFEGALMTRYGRDVEALDRETRSALSGR